MSSSENKKYDLEERTALFGENVIVFVRSIKQDEVNKPLIRQIVRSSTSIGANYMEADGGVSKKDFRNKIGTCKKEAKETKHWLRMISKANPEKTEECRFLWKEAHELVLIFSKIFNNSKETE
ncbi:MAG TPA: four helix bundle protein [Ignavibacteria bacterium]|nr:four helix bundle protein [Ignavibacteria bacterium]